MNRYSQMITVWELTICFSHSYSTLRQSKARISTICLIWERMLWALVVEWGSPSSHHKTHSDVSCCDLKWHLCHTLRHIEPKSIHSCCLHFRRNWFQSALGKQLLWHCPDGASAEPEIVLKWQHSLFFLETETITRKSWNCDWIRRFLDFRLFRYHLQIPRWH